MLGSRTRTFAWLIFLTVTAILFGLRPSTLQAVDRLRVPQDHGTIQAAIDSGTAYYAWNGDVVLDMSAAEYDGTAPDFGMHESGFSAATYTPIGTLSQGMYSLEVRIGASSDDAEELDTGSVSLNSLNLELAEVSGGAQTVGLRFPDVAIPADATISEAYVQFQVDETSSGNTELTIAGQANDNAPAFDSSGGDISSRLTTAVEVGWSPPEWLIIGEAGADQRNPGYLGHHTGDRRPGGVVER
ncbi:MAG TPA: hypothetical protein VLE70_17640 [Anaerolineae bacterium]|jgi:hypothetical protein|nr:hypothetical protein [Anaerolineae bacterium]